MKVLIIEDEVKAARELKKMVEAIRSDVEVVHLLPSVKAAVKWLREQPLPDLILADIQLADGLSFEIFKMMTIDVPVIFCTAFDAYAITAFETNSIDYLLKPVEEQQLAAALEKYDRLKRFFTALPGDYDRKMTSLVKQVAGGPLTTLLVYFQDRIIPLKTAEICFIHSSGGTVRAFMPQHPPYGVSGTLEELETQLSPHQFFRANRQFLINRAYIAAAEHFITRRLTVRLTCEVPEEIIISKARVPEFLRWMKS